MSIPTGTTAVEADVRDYATEISHSLGSIWQRHTGARPDAISTEIGADKVRCVIEGAEAPAPDEADVETASDAPLLLTVSAQRRDAIECVRRVTHRRIVGFISKRDAKAGTSTQTFILDRRHTKN
jgi:hypothetical protein